MTPVGMEPTISAGERPQTYALDRAATGTGPQGYYSLQITRKFKTASSSISSIYSHADGAYAWGEGGVQGLGGETGGKKDHWGDLGVDGWIILGWISRRWDVGIWTGFGWPRIGTGGGRL